ncbi:hypothetical protein ASG74_09960 [Knoellia sp. Soil729]|nr:hypothetical protein ASG74_09960 [Knoellia sp. Soil729]
MSQAVVDLGGGAVLLAHGVDRGQVGQRHCLPCRGGVDLGLGLFHDVEEVVGGEVCSGTQQRGIPARKGGGRGVRVHVSIIAERMFEWKEKRRELCSAAGEHARRRGHDPKVVTCRT